MNSLEAFKLEYEYQESPEDFKELAKLIRRIKLKKRKRTE